MKRTWKRVVKSMGAICFVTICATACVVARNEVEGMPAKIEAQAAKKSDVLSGRCGDYATFEYDQTTKTMVISGSGSMYDGRECYDYDDEDYINFLTEYPEEKKMIKSEMRKLVIGDKITSLGEFSFADCKALEEVHFGKKVSKISRSAFQGCTSLKKLDCTDSIKSIERDACNGCERLEKIYFGKEMKKIEHSAFEGCVKLKKITVHKQNKYFCVQGNSFMDKTKTKLILGCFAKDSTCHISDRVTQLNPYMLEEQNIENFKVSRNNKRFSSEKGLLYSKDGTLLYLCPRGKKGTAVVSDKAVKMKLYNEIYSSVAFDSCTKLEKIVLGKKFQYVNQGFDDCKKLKEVKISKKNPYLTAQNGIIYTKDKKTFLRCVRVNNKTVTIPEGVSKIGDSAFAHCEKVEHIVIQADKVELPYVKVERITFGKKYHIGDNFGWLSCLDKLKTLDVSEENPYYSSVDGVLYNKEQTKLLAYPFLRTEDILKMPNTVTSIRDGEDQLYGVGELYLSDAMTSFDLRLPELQKLHVGKKIKKLKLEELDSLEEITVDPENQTYGFQDGILYSKDGSRLIYCPRKKSGSVTIATGTAIIGEAAFCECYSIKEVVIPDTVTTIEKDAFQMELFDPEKTEFIFWVPAGKKEFYRSLLNRKVGFGEGMVIKETGY